VPQRVTTDAGDGGIRGTWDRDDCERFADRMQARVERLEREFREELRNVHKTYRRELVVYRPERHPAPRT
jgi:hypothetical protein